MQTDRIEKNVLLRAPRSRVWRALTDSKEFGSWFGMKLDGPFAPGAKLRGVITPTTVDAEVAAMQKPYAGKEFELVVDRIEAEHLFSFQWHPYDVQPGIDYLKEPMTLVTFTLEEQKGGVLLTVVESGFDKIPLSRRAEAFKANESGWAKQMELIAKYLAHAQ